MTFESVPSVPPLDEEMPAIPRLLESTVPVGPSEPSLDEVDLPDSTLPIPFGTTSEPQASTGSSATSPRHFETVLATLACMQA